MARNDGSGINPRSLPVPDIKQSTEYTCGPSALLAAARALGADTTEAQLASAAGTTKKDGTTPEGLVRAAQAVGLQAMIREPTTVADLALAVDRQELPIVALQAWAEKKKDYSKAWADGHFAVVTGIDAEKVTFEDPSVKGAQTVLPVDEFVRRWHDVDKDKIPRVQTAIFVKGSQPPLASPAKGKPRRMG